MTHFEPVKGVMYAHDYPHIFAKLSKEPEDERVKMYRWLCEHDLFFLMYFVIGHDWMNGSARHIKRRDGWWAIKSMGEGKDIDLGGPFPEEGEAKTLAHTSNFSTAKWWTDRCYEIETGPDTDTLDVWFRGGGKTNCLTEAENIQDVLKNRNELICILSYNKRTAKELMSGIKQICETNELLLEWYPEIFWENVRKAPAWRDDFLILKRDTNAREATFQAYGLIDNQPTGRHYTKLVFDDCVTRETVQTPGMLAKVSETYKMAQNLVIRGGGTRKRIIGTRYDYGDLYGEQIEKAEAGEIKLHVRKHPVYIDDEAGNREYFLLTPEEVENNRGEQGTYVFNCQMLLEPVSPDDQFFCDEGFRYWTQSMFLARGADFEANMPKYLLVDPAGWDESVKSITGCDTGMVVIGVGPDNEWYVLEALKGRFNPTQSINHMYRLHLKHKLKRIGIEDEKFGKMLRFDIDRQAPERGYLPIKPLPNTRGKTDRIEMLQPKWERGEIFLHASQTDLENQIRRYPGWREVDLLDALSHAPDMIELVRKRPAHHRAAKAVYSGRNRRGSW